MMTSPRPLDTSNRFTYTGTAAGSSDRLGLFAWIAHFALFFAAITCIVLPTILGATDQALVVRQIAYASYVLLMLIAGLFCARGLAWVNLFYLGCAAILSLAAMGTVLTMPFARPIDYLGPVSFLIGVHVFTNVLPRAFRGSAESIVLLSMVIVTVTVCLGFYFRFGVSVEQNNTVAAYTGLTTLLLVICALRRGTSPVVRLLSWGGAGVLLVVLATSFGRTSMIAFAGAGFLLVWLGSRSPGKVVLFLALLLAVCFVVGTDFGSSLLRTFLGKGLSWQKEQETIQTLSARTDIWVTGLSRAGWTWLGYGPLWIKELTGRDAHSSYLTIYFGYGILALMSWLVMCVISLWAAIKTARMYRGTRSFPLAPALVLYFLVISVAESFFGLLIGGFGILFYMGTGICLLELRRAQMIRAFVVNNGPVWRPEMARRT